MFLRRLKGDRRKPMTVVLWPLAGWFQKQLVRIAQRLQQVAGRLSFRTHCWLLSLFCLLFTSASIVVALSGLQDSKQALRITPIQTVAPAAIQQHRSFISREEFLRFQALQRYLDSLQTQGNGKRILDSLMQRHSHLPDTLRWLQSQYLHQQKQ